MPHDAVVILPLPPSVVSLPRAQQLRSMVSNDSVERCRSRCRKMSSLEVSKADETMLRILQLVRGVKTIPMLW